MFTTHTATNGITVQYTDTGVEYSSNGRLIAFSGEQTDGEVHLDNVFFGYYERNGDNVTITNKDGLAIVQLEVSEAAYEAFALQQLTVV